MADPRCCLANGDSQPIVSVPDCSPGVCCGDGSVWVGHEGCDDGVLNGAGDGSCLSDCSGIQTCGDGVANGTEDCDGTDDDWCPGHCQPDCTCQPGTKVPTVSGWGLIVMTLLVMTTAALFIHRRRIAAV